MDNPGQTATEQDDFVFMILYNVTLTVDLDVHQEWAAWMRAQHIPDVMSTGMFLSYRFSKLLDHGHEDAEIYTVQYLCKDRAHILRYQAEFAPDLQKEVRDKYAGKFAVFRTLMEVIDTNDKA